MRREDGDRALRDVGLLLHEDGPLRSQLRHDGFVVHDLLAHIHRRPVDLKRPFYRLHRAVHARTVAARGSQQQLLNRVFNDVGRGRRFTHHPHCRLYLRCPRATSTV